MEPNDQSSDRCFTLITAVGSDRPGIVDDISRWLFDLGMNIEDSRMALLGGEFAVLLLSSGSRECHHRLMDRREEFESRSGLTLFIRPVSSKRKTPVEPALPYSLTATSLDHPGIVFRVTSLLRSHNINIVSATTRTTPAPFTGTPIFNLFIEMDIPGDVSPARLREELKTLGERENIDFELTCRT